MAVNQNNDGSGAAIHEEASPQAIQQDMEAQEQGRSVAVIFPPTPAPSVAARSGR